MYTRFIILFFCLGYAAQAQAQLVPDNTLGTENSRFSQPDPVISGGARRGSNLFHSFREFNVGESQRVYFENPAGVDRILTRVTGTNPSLILGTLGVLGNADLFLLNPNGVFLGANARLDINGAFLATTGDRFSFDNNYEFGAIDPTVPPLLTVSAPIGIQLGTNPGAIQVRDARLSVPQSFELVGENISFDNSKVNANGIELTGNRIDVVQSRLQSTTGDGDGETITVNAQRLNLLRGGQLASISRGRGEGSDIRVNVSDRLWIGGSDPQDSRQFSGLGTLADASGDGGDIHVSTRRLILRNGGSIAALTTATGQAGDVNVRATQSLDAAGTLPVFSNTGSNIISSSVGAGSGGDVTVVTSRLALRSGNRIQTHAWSTGAGGDVNVSADRILLRGVNRQIPSLASGILALTAGDGEGGDVNVRADRLVLDRSSFVLTLSYNYSIPFTLTSYTDDDRFFTPFPGNGSAGDLSVRANSILIRGASPAAPSQPTQLSSITLTGGDAGDVSVAARRLRIQEGGGVLSANLESVLALGLPTTRSVRGQSGDVTINAQDIVVEGTNPDVEVGSLIGTLSLADGEGGRTTIATDNLLVRNGGAINSGTYASGNAGSLTIDARRSIRVEGTNDNGLPSSIGTFANIPDASLRAAYFLPPLPKGDTGALRIRTPDLQVRNGGEISVQHQGMGNAGRMRIEAARLVLDDGALTAETASGLGGNINLQVDRLQLSHSRITATALGNQGNGGNLTISSGVIIASPNSNNAIAANARTGRGGNIRIRSQGLLGLQRSDITASSLFGLDGTVSVNAPEIDTDRDVDPLPDTPSDPSDQIATGCARNAAAYFAIAGRGGLPADPRQPLPGQVVIQDWREMPPATAAAGAIDSPAATVPIAEAQGWQINGAGQVELVARSAIENDWDNRVSCDTLK
jgi:filamentous hemagglutinin family protein